MIQWAEIKVNLKMAVKNMKICPYCNSNTLKKMVPHMEFKDINLMIQ